ncbi:hypothetical protein PJI74_29505, partial [Mycobacterium kansasii]
MNFASNQQRQGGPVLLRERLPGTVWSPLREGPLIQLDCACEVNVCGEVWDHFWFATCWSNGEQRRTVGV